MIGLKFAIRKNCQFATRSSSPEILEYKNSGTYSSSSLRQFRHQCFQCLIRKLVISISIKMDDESVKEKAEPAENAEVMSIPQRLRLPNDLIYQLKVVTGESHGLPDAVGDETRVIAATVPALVNFRVDSSEEEMVSNIKYGYSEGTKVPMTCMESGSCFNVQLEPNMTVLVDRPLQVHSWVHMDGVIGFITNMTSSVDLEIRNTSTVIAGIKGSDLRPVSPFCLGMYVYFNGWIGCVISIEHKLHIRYEKGGYEGYLTETEDGFKAYRRNFSYSFVGDEISPSGADVNSVKWISSPPLLHWFLLRYLNFGYTNNTIAEVIGNEVNIVTVDWHCSTYPEGKEGPAQPQNEIPKNLLHKLERLDLTPDWWYGMNVKYTLTETDRILDGDKWDERIAETFGLKSSSSSSRPQAASLEQGDTVGVEEELKNNFEPGDEIVGKIVFRRAMARVLWEDGRTSVMRVQNLIPYYPPTGVEFPLPPGTVVYKPQSPFKAVIQTSHRDDGAARVRWFGEHHHGDVPDSMPLCDESEEDTYELDIEESLIHIGLIVIRRTDCVPGVVIGVNIENGMLRIKFGDDTRELETARVVKFKKVAHFIQGQIFWGPLKTHPLTVQKHVVKTTASCTQFGNTIPPQLVTHGAPVKVLDYEELPEAPISHHFFCEELPYDLTVDEFSPFLQARKDELQCIKFSPPKGMWIKTYADRLNLMSVLMRGLPDTPLESGLFQFDLCLTENYPPGLPKVAYVKHDFEPAQIELEEVAEDGILDMEAMFENKPGLMIRNILEEIRTNLLGLNNKESKTSYTGSIRNLVSNQKVVISLIPAITSWLVKPPPRWETEVLSYYRFEAPRHIVRMKKWLAFSRMYLEHDLQDEDFTFAEGEGAKYPLLPIDVISHAEIRNDLSDLTNAYAKIF